MLDPILVQEEEVFRSIMRTALLLWSEASETLKPAGLTHAQYNVLRILRRVEPYGMPSGSIGEEMLTRDSDLTRLLDRLQTRGLVTRERDIKDRRVIIVRITEAGLQLLSELDEPMAGYHRRQLGHLEPEQLHVLSSLLNTVLRRKN